MVLMGSLAALTGMEQEQDGAPPHQHCAGATGSYAATILRSLEAGDVAEHPKKRHVWLDIRRERLAVNG